MADGGEHQNRKSGETFENDRIDSSGIEMIKVVRKSRTTETINERELGSRFLVKNYD